MARKIAAFLPENQLASDWPACDWCGMKWNPSKVPVWLGKKTCPNCKEFPTRILHNMLALKLVKLRKHSKLPKAKPPTDWGHLGTFDPKRPWMKWTECAFCTIPQCMNNNIEHKSKVRTYKGNVICVKCRNNIKLMLPQLVKMKYLRVRES